MRFPIIALLIAVTAEGVAAPLVVQQIGDANFLPRSRRDIAEFGTFVEFHGELYFTASIGDDRYQLFKTDGSTVASFDVDPGFHIGIQFVEFENQLYFRGGDGNDIELFRTDGQSLDKFDLSNLPSGSGPRNFSVVGDRLYFEANLPNEVGGVDPYLLTLHNSTITPLGQMSVQASYPWHVVAGTTVYFTSNGPEGFELYRTSGDSVEQVVDANPGLADSNPWPGTAVGEDFYFTAIGPAGRELYRASRDTVAKLPFVPDPDMYGGPVNFVSFGDSVYFAAGGANGYELFRARGDTVTELDLAPGPASSSATVNGSAFLGDAMLVPAYGSNGLGLFVVDVDGNVTRQFDFHPREQRGGFVFHNFQGEAYFEGTGPDGHDLYKTDGNALTKFEIVPDDLPNGGVAIWGAVEFRGELYFAASTPNGGELVKTDGERITAFDLNPGAPDSWPSYLQVIDDHLVFQARDESGYHIFSSDGDTIQRIVELTPYTYLDYDDVEYILPSATQFARMGDQLFFLGHTSNGFRLHRISAVPEPYSWALTLLAMTSCSMFCWRLRTNA